MTTVFRPWSKNYKYAANPEYHIVAFPIGGETNSVWTSDDVSRIPVPGKLPIWVQREPQGTMQGAWDGALAREILTRYGTPPGNRLALDMGGSVDEHYVNAFAYAARPYLTMLFGTAPGVFQNPGTSGGVWLCADSVEAAVAEGSVLTEYLATQSGGWSIGIDSIGEPYWGFGMPAPVTLAHPNVNGAGLVQVVLEDDWTSGPRWHKPDDILVADQGAVSGGIYTVPYETYQLWVAAAETHHRVQEQISGMMLERKQAQITARADVPQPEGKGEVE